MRQTKKAQAWGYIELNNFELNLTLADTIVVSVNCS